MGRRNLPFTTPSPSPWHWPSCSRPRTSSFRAVPEASSSESSSAITNGIRSDRLFFDPARAGYTSSILAVGREKKAAPAFEGGVAVVVESNDLLKDFRASMEEMLEAPGARDWAWMERMLGWFLRANGKGTHGFIIGAFMDLVIALAASSSSLSSPSPHSHGSFSSCSSNSFYVSAVDQEMDDVKESGNV